jgi:hypothetical protein
MHIIINYNGIISAEANIQHRFNSIEVRRRLLGFLHKYSWTLISNEPSCLYKGVVPRAPRSGSVAALQTIIATIWYLFPCSVDKLGEAVLVRDIADYGLDGLTQVQADLLLLERGRLPA